MSRRKRIGRVAGLVLAGSMFVAVCAERVEAGVGVLLELRPDKVGPYLGGETITVEVILHSFSADDFTVERIQLDFSKTDTALALSPAFSFDLSGIPSGNSSHWVIEADLPVPWTVGTFGCFCPTDFLAFPSGGALGIGTFDVTLPNEVGTYAVDVLNRFAVPQFDVNGHVGGLLWLGPACLTCPGGGDVNAFDDFLFGLPLNFVVVRRIPAASQWGLAAMGLMLLCAASLVIRYRKGATVTYGVMVHKS